jgi:autotransporter-associated beta strand protein
MKPSSPLRNFLLAAGSSLIAVSSTNAADGTWDTDLAGNWTDFTNWFGDTAYASDMDSTAIFGNVITADRIITLNSLVTIGNITASDTTHNYTISGANTITLDRTTGVPIIDVGTSGRTLFISSQISGVDGLQKNGTGTLSLSGNNNYTGTTVISNGILAISSNNALGSSAAGSNQTTITATGLSTGPQLSLSGGITSAENISISGLTDQNNGYNGVITNTSGTNTLSGAITLANPSGGIRLGSGGGELIFSGTISQTTGTSHALTLQAATGAALTVNNAIANNNGPLFVINTGVTTLKGASTTIGATTIAEGGYLKLGVTNAIKDNQNLTIGGIYNFTGSDQGTFDLAGFNQTVNALVGNKNTTAGTIGADSTRIVTNSVTGTSTLTVGNGNASGTFNGVIRDGGAGKIVALTKTGSGTLTLVGDSNYSGVTVIGTNAGTVTISHNNALGSTAGNTTIAANGTASGRLVLSGGITTPENITITGATEASGFNPVISGSGTLSGTITLSSLTSGIRVAGVTFSGTIQQTGSSQNLVLQGATVNNAIQNNGGALLTAGSGTSTLRGVSGTGIGETQIIQNTTLVLGVTDALNTTANLSVSSGTSDQGTFRLNGFNQTVNALNSAASGTTRLIHNNHASNASILTVGNGGGTGTFNGTIVNGSTATLALVKTGAGNQTLSGTNTYTGGTTISGGTLTLANATNTLANNGAVNVNGGTLALGANSDTVGAVTLTSGSITGAGTLTGSAYDVRSGSVSAKLAGSVGFSKSTSGTATLSGLNTYTGTTTVQAGALVAGADALVSSNSAFGNASSALVLGNASTLAGDAPSVLIGGAFTVARAITVGTGAATAYNATLGGSNTSGTSIFSGGITLTDTGSYTTTLQAATGGIADFQGAFTTNNKAIAIGSSGNTGTVKLTNTISTSGGVSVNFGTLLLGSSDRLSDTTPVTVAGGTLDLAALTDTVASFSMSSGALNGTGTLTATTYLLTGGTLAAKLGAGAVTVDGSVTFSAAERLNASSSLLLQSGILTLAGDQNVDSFQQTGGTLAGGFSVNSASNYDLQSGTLTGNLGGSSGLTKTGEGTTILSGTNTYTGVTNVNSGKLVVNGNISSSSLTSVASGATIGGSGTVGELTVSSGGFINPGNSPGILNVSGDYTQAGLYTAEITGLTAGTEHDQINVTGSVDITGGDLTALFTAGTYAANDIIFILLNDGVDAITGTYSGFAQGATVIEYDGFEWKISYTANSTTQSFTGGNDIALMAIPEPKAALLGGLGLLLLLRRCR